MKKENILVLFGADSTLEWGRSFQLAKAFKANGHNVLYIDIPSPVRHCFSFTDPKQFFGDSGLHVFQPRWGLPYGKFPWLRRLNYLSVKSQIVGYLERTGFKPSIIWTYAPYEPMTTKFLRDTYSPKLVIHDIADERISLAEAQAGVKAGIITKQLEEEIASYCDAVVTITEKLKKTKKHLHETIIVMPNGIDMEMFDNKAEHVKPDNLAKLSGKIVLYIGAIENWVDIEAINVAALASPSAQFVLVGPIRLDISKLTKLENIHVIGARPYSEMPAYIAHADVCILPFKDNEITRNSDPLKLLQYLSMCKPVVALRFQGINDFGGAVSVASGYEEFAAMIAFADTVMPEVASIVKGYDWKYLVSRTIQQLEELKV